MNTDKIIRKLIWQGAPDLVPCWDASAAGINASALLKLTQYVNKNEAKDYICKAEKFIRTLSSEKYLTKAGGNDGYVDALSTVDFIGF